MKSRILATLAVAVVLALGVSAPAFAQPYTGALSANSCAPGGSVHYKSDNTGQHHGTKGSYTLTGDHSGALGGPVVNLAASVTHSVVVGSHNQLSFTVKIPADAKPGSVYTLSVKAGKFSDTQSINVVGVPASAAGVNLTPLWIAIAAVVLVLLFLIFYVARRRRNAAASTVTTA